jgi:hypothetical protein
MISKDRLCHHLLKTIFSNNNNVIRRPHNNMYTLQLGRTTCPLVVCVVLLVFKEK